MFAFCVPSRSEPFRLYSKSARPPMTSGFDSGSVSLLAITQFSVGAGRVKRSFAGCFFWAGLCFCCNATTYPCCDSRVPSGTEGVTAPPGGSVAWALPSCRCSGIPRQAYGNASRVRRFPHARRRGREAEGGGLLNRYRVVTPYRGFESLRLRHSWQIALSGTGYQQTPAATSTRAGNSWPRPPASRRNNLNRHIVNPG